jgi:meiotically up-regulated gene 157 (Mug157) protein
MSIITRAMTSDDDAEIQQCLEILKNTTANTYFMHEAFLANNSIVYTRPWFAWANSYFGELILDLLKRKPHLITKKTENTKFFKILD